VSLKQNDLLKEKTNKKVYIIAGPNGSGKTTFANIFLPEYAKCDFFINADLIALGLSPFSPQQVAMKAGRLVLEQIIKYSESGLNFGFETTMAGVTYLKYFKMLKEKGYKIHVFFLWLPNTHLAIARVKNRVTQGGHNVATSDIKRRFKRSTYMFFTKYYSLIDEWMIFDNSHSIPNLIASKKKFKIDVFDKKLFLEVTKKVGVSI